MVTFRLRAVLLRLRAVGKKAVFDFQDATRKTEADYEGFYCITYHSKLYLQDLM